MPEHALHNRIFMMCLLLVSLVLATATSATAQTPAASVPPPPPGWIGSAGAGLALTSGNSDTSTVNAAYEVKRDTGGDFGFRSSWLLVWGQSEGVQTSDRLSLDGRVERKLNTRTAVFAQTQYLRDAFKSIDYLISPTVGVSRRLVKNERTELGVDAAVGVVWERNPELELQTDAALTSGQQFTHQLTATTELTERFVALWKMDDLGDALYTFGAGIAASITAATQLKVEFLDSYKTRPPLAGVQSNDIAVLVSFVYKFD
jgi:putative salt-induced outer membrane protein